MRPSAEQPGSPANSVEIRAGQRRFSLKSVYFEAIADTLLFGADPSLGQVPELTLAKAHHVLSFRRKHKVRLPIGLLARCIQLLLSAGLRPIVRDMGGNVVFPVNSAASPRHTISNALCQMPGRNIALAVMPSLQQRLQFIAEIWQQSAETHIAVIVPNLIQSRAVARQLTKLIGSRVSWHVTETPTYPWLHVFSVGTYLGSSTVEWKILIYLNAEDGLSKTSMREVSRSYNSLRMGLLTRDDRALCERDRLNLESLFGPVVWRACMAPTGVEVGTWILPPPSYPAAEATTSRLEQKRHMIWRNDIRNDEIAHAAAGIANGDVDAIRGHGLLEPSQWLSGDSSIQRRSVAVVVENVEHAREIAHRLTGWPVLSQSDGTPDSMEFVVSQSAIVTLPRASRSGLATEVIVYAPGSGEQWPDRIGPEVVGENHRRTVVVDIADDADETMRCQVRSRKRDYVTRGWKDLLHH
jgi:hypothetical protein